MFNELPASKINNPKIVPQVFRESAVDGIIVNLLPVFSPQTVEYFERQPLPCVLLNLKRPLRCVYPDEFSGSAVAVKWLQKRGHQRIGYFSRQFPPAPHYSALDRFAGFQQAMKALGLPSDRHLELVRSRDAAAVPSLQRAEIFLQMFPDVDAVLCYEMEEAVCIAYAAERRGIRVPQQLEVVSFSERDVRGNTGLAIPTVLIPFQEVGRCAVEMLEVMIEDGNREVPSVAVPYKNMVV